MTKHQRIKVMNVLVFACKVTKEAYNTNMPFRYCPSCGDEINESDEKIRRLLA